jgi:hypothetical protein
MSKVLKIESVKNTVLYKKLLERANENTRQFVANIPDLCDEAADRAKQIPKFFSEYTLHDITHFLRVTEIMSYILGKTIDELNDIEIGLLILSAFYHDQGMLITDADFKDIENNDTYLLFRDNWIIEHPNYAEIKKQFELQFISCSEKERIAKIIAELDSAMLTDFLRANHGQRSHDYVLSTFVNDRALIVNGTNISNILAKLCLSHVNPIDWISDNNGFHYDENIGTDKVNSIYLSIVLRLADILDFDSDRTPDVLFKSIHFTNPISITEWQKHRNVKGWEISKEIIRYAMYFEHPVYEKTAKIFISWIDAELYCCHSLVRNFPSSISKYQLPIPESVDRSRLGPKDNSYIYHDLEFTLSRDEIVKLLLTENLYKNKSLFIRELLQNSLDALRLRKAVYLKDRFEWSSGEIIFKHYIDSDNQQIVECSDNGCGMDENIVIKYLGKVGRSYYRSPEFEMQKKQLKENGIDFEPCSQFGIGFMSCFMIGDRIQIFTRKDYGQGKAHGKPLIIEVNGLGGLIVIKYGDSNQKIGTTVKIFTRQKPVYFDKSTDTIRLIDTLKGYAMATEFPINAVCQIDKIKGEVTIPTTIDKKNTFLESLKQLNKTKTYEVDLHEIHKNLNGFLRQTFIVDDNEIPCIENSEARWETRVDSKVKNGREKIVMSINLINGNHNFDYPQHVLDEERSICLDGILVCGNPGRSEFLKEGKIMLLQHHAARIFCEHPFTLDVRGNIKPELNPAREPLGEVFRKPVGWDQLQSFVDRGSGLLWEKVLEQTEKGLSPETFWKLLVAYEGAPFSINCKTLLKHLYLPVKGKDWVKLSTIRSCLIANEMIKVKDKKDEEYIIYFSDEITSWGRTHINDLNLSYWISKLLICLSKFQAINSESFILRDTFGVGESPADNYVNSELTTVNTIPFEDLNCSYITTTKYTGIANSDNALVKVYHNSRFVKNKSEIQAFAKSFLTSIFYLIKQSIDDKKPFITDVTQRSLQYPSALFLNINWSKYNVDLKPPYNIFIDEKTTVGITENDFRKWAKQ